MVVEARLVIYCEEHTHSIYIYIYIYIYISYYLVYTYAQKANKVRKEVSDRRHVEVGI